MKLIALLKSPSHRLHVLYLVHDVLQTEAAGKRDAPRPIIRAFKPYLAWLLRPAFQLAQATSPEEGPKVLRLLQLWVERSIIDTKEAEEMRALVTIADLPRPAAATPLPTPPTVPRPTASHQMVRPQGSVAAEMVGFGNA